MPFNISDQDALNIAMMYSKYPLRLSDLKGWASSTAHPMVMYHAVAQKPWRGSFLLRALRGMPPTGAMKYFFTVVDAPIRAYSPLQLRAKRTACSIAALIGRFYSRR